MTREQAEKEIRDNFTEVWADGIIKALEPKPMEKFKSVKDHIFKLAGDYKCWDNRLTDDEALELCHLLEQETVTKEVYDHEYYLRKILENKIAKLEHDKNKVLDKIRAEIIEDCGYSKDYVGVFTYSTIKLETVLQIIDKYKAESEEV